MAKFPIMRMNEKKIRLEVLTSRLNAVKKKIKEKKSWRETTESTGFNDRISSSLMI
jgi:hypothetical protein